MPMTPIFHFEAHIQPRFQNQKMPQSTRNPKLSRRCLQRLRDLRPLLFAGALMMFVVIFLQLWSGYAVAAEPAYAQASAAYIPLRTTFGG
jgi:hypothetical protein